MADLAQPLAEPLASPAIPAEEPTFVNRVNGFFNQNPVLGGLLAATPWGGRILSALGTLTLVEQRKAEMARQEALESQLSQIGSAEETEDPVEGLTRLAQIDRKGFRPLAYQAVGKARTTLTNRGAARAVANAQFQSDPGTTQAFPMSPDRPDRAGIRPPEYFTDDQVKMRSLGREAGPPMPSASAMDRSGEMATTAQIMPPQYRYPQSREELMLSLKPDQRELVLQANLHQMPPDLAAVEIAQGNKTTKPEVGKSLDAMMDDLNQFEQGVDPGDAGTRAKIQLARRQIQIAKTHPQAINDARIQYNDAIGASTKFGIDKRNYEWKQTLFKNHQTEFAQQVDLAKSRIKEAMRTNDINVANGAIDNLRQMTQGLQTMIKDLESTPGAEKLVEAMRKEYNENMTLVTEMTKRYATTFRPPTRGDEIGSGQPGAWAGEGRPREGASRPPSAAPAPSGPKTMTLRSGKVITVEE